MNSVDVRGLIHMLKGLRKAVADLNWQDVELMNEIVMQCPDCKCVFRREVNPIEAGAEVKTRHITAELDTVMKWLKSLIE